MLGRGRLKKKSYITVLDIGTSKICGLMVHIPTDNKPEVVGFGYAPSRGVKSGTIVDLDKATECVGAVLMQIEKQSNRQVDSVVVNISSGQLKSHHLYQEMNIADGHPITATDVKHLVDKMVATCISPEDEVIHTFPLGYVVDKEQGLVDPRGLYATTLGAHVHVITIPETQLRNLVMVLDRCHVSIESKVATPYASALAVLSDEEKEIGASILDIGGGTTSIAMFLGGGLVHLGLVSQGGNIITRDIAQGLSTPLVAAERLKTLNGAAFLSPKDELERVIVQVIGEEDGSNVQVPRADLIKIIVPRLEEILEKSLDVLSEKEAFLVAARRLVLCGGGSELQGLKEKSASSLNANVRLGKACVIKNLPNQFDSYTFVVCIGLLKYVLSSYQRMPVESFDGKSGQQSRLGKVIQWLVKNF